MSEELKNLDFPGRKEDILFFLQNIIGKQGLLRDDVRVLCSHAPGIYQLYADSLISYCASFGWISCDESACLNDEFYPFVESSDDLNNALIKSTINKLFQKNIFKADMFFYDFNNCRILFKNELLPLSYSAVRNVLISQGFFETERVLLNCIYISPIFENIVLELCKKSRKNFSLAKLKDDLEKNAIAGAKAEEYVLEFEKKRITNPGLLEKIRIISEIDVCAGYDILSFESNDSLGYDRFIEVKAVSRKNGFYWSSNEFEIARLKGAYYHLYLVDLLKISQPDYVPTIVTNPANAIMHSDDWLVEPQTYQIRKLGCSLEGD